MTDHFDKDSRQSDHFNADMPMTAARTIALYRDFYETLSGAADAPILPAGHADDVRHIAHLTDVIDDVDGFILDSYGVIGLGSAPIDGIQSFFAAAAAKEKPIVILTNGASQPAANRLPTYLGWDLPVVTSDIISSRDAAYYYVKEQAQKNPDVRLSYLCANVVPFADLDGPVYGARATTDFGYDWHEADLFCFMGATSWSEAAQQHLEEALTAAPHAKLLIANPDVSAPVGQGFSFEPGFWGMRAQAVTHCALIMTGKPFQPAYGLAVAALEKKAGKHLHKSKIAMVGDSLHTDILGAKTFGLTAVLLKDYGLLRGWDSDDITKQCQIFPDIICAKL